MSERNILDEIDALVDESLSRGDQSDEYHGSQWRENHPCPWCVEGYHYLPITQNMWRMRQGSYGRDEFGYGIVDPEYSFEEDDSMILCPGSEFHGPPYYFNGLKLWDKQSRERAATIQGPTYPSRLVTRPTPAGPLRRLRFYGLFSPVWTVGLQENYVMAGQEEIQRQFIATFELATPLYNLHPDWVRQNQEDIEELAYSSGGQSMCRMNPIVFEFDEFTVFSDDRRAEDPAWIEFTTDYPIERHSWFMNFWTVHLSISTPDTLHLRPAHPMPDAQHINTADIPIVDHDCCDECTPGIYHHMDHGECNSGAAAMAQAGLRQGLEPDFVIIDEAYQHNDEELRQYVEEARARISTQEASGTNER